MPRRVRPGMLSIGQAAEYLTHKLGCKVTPRMLKARLHLIKHAVRRGERDWYFMRPKDLDVFVDDYYCEGGGE